MGVAVADETEGDQRAGRSRKQLRRSGLNGRSARKIGSIVRGA